MKKKPNILWLTLDHLTYSHYRNNKGAKPILPTWERICAEGTSFEQCKSVHPLCLPARASMLTGVYTHKHGMLRNEYGFVPHLAPPTPDLKNAGYRLGYFGKNHSGYEDLDTYGFEGYFKSPFGNPYGNPFHTQEYKEYLERKGLKNPIFVHEWGLHPQFAPGGEYDITEVNYFNHLSCGVFKEAGGYHEADFLLDMSVDWVRERVAEDEPFILRMDPWGPHQAYMVPPDFADTLYDEKEILPIPGFDRASIDDKPAFVQQYLDGVRSRTGKMDTWDKWQHVLKRTYENYTYVDMRFGLLLDEIEKLGIADNTYIIWTADHGDALASQGGMVDKCGDMAEELMDIPMAIAGPGIPKGTVINGYVSNLDVLPTVFDFAGVEMPYKPDGISLKQAAKDGRGRDVIMCEHYGHHAFRFVQRCVYKDDWKYIVTEKGMPQLYNVADDPYEQVNLANAQPARCREMHELLAKQIETFNDSPLILKY